MYMWNLTSSYNKKPWLDKAQNLAPNQNEHNPKGLD
jgi:hypothetical protein